MHELVTKNKVSYSGIECLSVWVTATSTISLQHEVFIRVMTKIRKKKGVCKKKNNNLSDEPKKRLKVRRQKQGACKIQKKKRKKQ